MNLSHKDRSLILLIFVSLIILWLIFSSFSKIFFSATFHISDATRLTSIKKDKWLNTSKSLTKSDIEDRIILLDFWSYSCVTCIQSLPQIKNLENRFGNKLLIIGVHSKKFDNEKDLSAIKKSILKYDITYPVINDDDLTLWNAFKVKSWPTFVLLNPRGNIAETYFATDDFTVIKNDIKKLISKFKFQLNRDPLPILLEKHDITSNVLSFPSKIAYASKFSFGSFKKSPTIFISNSGQNNIVATSLSGRIIAEIGSGHAGFSDGSFSTAAFNHPQGLLFDKAKNKLYVADLGNNALREIDFKKETVKTLIGSGVKGGVIKDNEKLIKIENFNLSAPTDLEFLPDSNKKSIIIANSASNQILLYNISKKTISLLAGSGKKGLKDGVGANASLAQTTDLALFGNKVYFIDSESSSLRELDKKGSVKTLIGQSLNKFGHKNGAKEQALMQHPTSLHVDDTGVYISDSFNHTIRKYDFSSKKIKDLIGSGTRGNNLGSGLKIKLNEPDGIVSALHHFYIADSNNNRILSVSRSRLDSKIINVMPPLKLPKEGFLEYLPNLHKSSNYEVKSDSELSLKVSLKKGWKINELGPSFVNLLRLIDDQQANLVVNFDWQQISNKKMKLPKLIAGEDYVLQGTIYYCEDKENALCYIKSYEQKLLPSKSSKSKEVLIEIVH